MIPQNELDDLRKIRPIPIVVVPPSYDAAQRYACIHFGAAQYLHSFHNPYENETNSENSMRNFLRIPCEKQKPLTIITMKGLSVCLEHRTVPLYKMMVLDTSQIIAPREHYQREIKNERVKRIVKDFDERIANEPKVSYRDGKYFVFDGQHTIDARKVMNGGEDLPKQGSPLHCHQ